MPSQRGYPEALQDEGLLENRFSSVFDQKTECLLGD